MLQCEGYANPPPKFEWLQKLTKVVSTTTSTTSMTTTTDEFDEFDDDIDDNDVDNRERRKRDDEMIFLRGTEKMLEFRNISYEQEGQWVCVATNTIKGKLFVDSLWNQVPPLRILCFI